MEYSKPCNFAPVVAVCAYHDPVTIVAAFVKTKDESDVEHTRRMLSNKAKPALAPADERENLPFCHRKVEPVQHHRPWSLRVREVHFLERD
jgi:hypothetical protein